LRAHKIWSFEPDRGAVPQRYPRSDVQLMSDVKNERILCEVTIVAPFDLSSTEEFRGHRKGQLYQPKGPITNIRAEGDVVSMHRDARPTESHPEGKREDINYFKNSQFDKHELNTKMST